jgi:PAS domain S-box-containing protein
MRPVRIVFSDLIFIFIITLLAGISVLSYQRIMRFNAAYAWVSHSDQVKLKLVQALSYLKDSEAGARGFLLTKDSSFLVPFTGSEDKTNKILASLDSLIQDAKDEVLNLQSLREMVKAKFKNLNEILRNPDVPPAVNHNRLLEENQLMIQCREIILRMNRTENKLLQERTENKDRYVTITPLYSLIFSILAIIIVILTYFRLRSETSLRFRAEDSEAKIITAGKRLEETELRLRLAIEAAALGTFDWNFANQTFLSSPRLNEIFGFGNQPATHQDLIDALHPDDLPLREKAVADSYTTGALTYEVRIIWPDQSVRWVSVHGKVIYDDNRQPARMYGTVMDIQEQKNFTQELEEKVGQRTLSLIEANDQLENTIMELEQSNAELESFNYVASHDLQEPLRKIIAFCQRITDKDGSGLSESGKDYFNRITRAAMRMQNLIDAFLSYSQTANSAVSYEQVDLNILLEEVKNDLREIIDEKKAVIQSVRLPVIPVIPLQFQQLMINLISNALKYSKPDGVPVITIAASQVSGSDLSEEENNPEANYWKITVSDNGIGFEQQYGHKIFELFQRLHPKSDYTGTGIGLAICKKIVRNHKGFISATGELGIGAVFSIFIPLTEPKQN